jgi:hypothetical protein
VNHDDGHVDLFDRATAVAVREDGDDGSATYDVNVDGGWAIGDRPHGGYLLALVARAAGAAIAAVEGPDHPHVLSATVTYVGSPVAGPAEVRTEVLRRGRSASQARARLVQGGAALVEAVFLFGSLAVDTEPWWGGEPVPAGTAALAARADEDGAAGGVRRTSEGPNGMRMPIMERVEMALDPETAGFAAGQPSGRGEVRGWLRMAGGREPDPLALLYAVDALPPATFDLAEANGWVPTLSLTAYIRALPAPGPLVVRQRARLVEGGFVDEGCDVWDSRGRVVAQATQLAGVRTP